MNEMLARIAFKIPDWLYVGNEVWILDVEEVPASERCVTCGHKARPVHSYTPRLVEVTQIHLSAFITAEETFDSVSIMLGDEQRNLDEVWFALRDAQDHADKLNAPAPLPAAE